MKILIPAIAAALIVMMPFQGEAQVTTPQPDTVRLRLAREMLNANGGAQAMQARVRGVFTSIQDLTKNALGSADPKTSELASAVMNYAVDQEIQAVPQLIDEMATIYADNLSEQELRDMLAWSLSPSGRSIQTKMSVISQQMIAAQGPLLKKIMSGAMTTAVDRACAEFKCTNDERLTVTSIVQKSLPPS